MFTLDPYTAHVIALAKEKLQDQLVYLENALKEKPYGTKTKPIYGLVFFIAGTELHVADDIDPEVEINAVSLLNSTGIDSVYRNDLSQAIMNWFANPTYQ